MKEEKIEIHTIKDKMKNQKNGKNNDKKKTRIHTKKFYFDFKHDSLMTNLKHYTRYLIKHPDSSKFISFINSLLQIYLFFAIMTFCFQTVPRLNDTPQKERFWKVSEAIFTIIFTTEYLVRLIVYPLREKNEGKSKIKCITKFVTKTMNIIDVVSLIPFYLETIFPTIFSGYGNPMTLIIRSLKLFRLFRIFSHSNKFSLQIQIVSQAFIQSKDGIIILIWAFGLSIIFFSTLFYIAETSQCIYDEKDRFWYTKETYDTGNKESCTVQSIVSAFWWACVTIATVGYGDVVPHTIAGKIISGLTMTCALLISSIPVTILSYNLSNLYSTYQNKKHDIKKEGSRKLSILKLLTETKESQESLNSKDSKDDLNKNDSTIHFGVCAVNENNHEKHIKRNSEVTYNPNVNTNSNSEIGSQSGSLTNINFNSSTADITERFMNNNNKTDTDLTDHTYSFEKINSSSNSNINTISSLELTENNKAMYNLTLKQYQENLLEIQNLTDKLIKLKNMNSDYESVLKSFDKKNI